MNKTTERHVSSFRDPSGFMFTRNGTLYRQVNRRYQPHYDLLLASKLYDQLVDEKLLIGHHEVDVEPMEKDAAYKVISPQLIPFISYSSEWCFSQLKDAALLTMNVVLKALDAGMVLKDASAYNVQFYQGKPILVDTLSFETYVEGEPWQAYRQFCQHFLAPLALMSFKDARLNKLSSNYIDGIPLDLASKLLPPSTWLNYRLLTHLHLHSRWQGQARPEQERDEHAAKPKMSKQALIALLGDLKNAVQDLHYGLPKSNWTDYTSNNNYQAVSVEGKRQLVDEFIRAANPKSVIDLGSNTGDYSRLAAKHSALAIAADFDHDSVELNYRRCVQENERLILPLVIDLNSPTPAIGFANTERDSFLERAKVDLVMALALVHHLAIANNVPLYRIAELFSQLGKFLVIEFVPKEDTQVQTLLATREDIFDDYTQAGFERAFEGLFTIVKKQTIEGSVRSLYLMKVMES